MKQGHAVAATWRGLLRFLIRIAVLLGMAGVVQAGTGTQIAVLPPHLDGFNLAPYLSYWYDPASNSSLESARAHWVKGDFGPLPNSAANLGFASGSHWFHLALRNTLTKRRMVLVQVDYPVLDQLEFFCNSPGQMPVYYPAGDHLQFSSRVIKVRNFVIPLTLQSQGWMECLIRVHSTSNVIFPIHAFDTIPYLETNERVDWRLGILYGIAISLLLYNLVIYFSTRERVYLYFVLHVLGGLGYTTTVDGTLANFWTSLDLQDLGMLISISIGGAASILFGLEYLQIRSVWPAAYRLGKVLFFIMAAFGLLCLIEPLLWSHYLLTVTMLVVGLFLFFLGIWRLRDGYAPAQLYVIGYGTVMLMVVWISLNVLVLNGDVRWITYGFSFAWLCELILLSVGLSQRIQETKKVSTVLSQQVQAAQHESNIKTEFMAKVSHEVRTPMNGIMGLVELLMGTRLDDDQRRYLSAIKHAGLGLQEVINDVLDFSRIEAGKLVLAPAPFELQPLLQDVCGIYEFEARRKRIELGCFIDEGTPLQLIGDAGRIRQVLLNLLSNALKYTDQGYVHINVHLTDQILADQLVLSFEVEDSGVGISAQDQNKLFQSFSQLVQNRSGAVGGSGLGLMISQQLVELMGGELGVKSELGKGSCFWFTLPLELPEDVAIAPGAIVLDLFDGMEALPAVPVPVREPKPEPQPRQGLSWRVLVVEDNEINQNVIIGFLQKLGITPDLADNGRTAVEMVQQGREYDLILMDCEMPVMDGYEAASRILKWQRQKGVAVTPIIALSAHALDKHRAMAFDVGMADYLAKPMTFRQLVDKIGRYIDLPKDNALLL